MKKILIIAIVVIIVLICAVVLFFLFFSPEGYKPGKLANRENLENFLTPPGYDAEDNYWKVSEDISLYFSKSGEGEAVLVLHGGPGFPSAENWKGLDLLNDENSFYYYHQRGSGFSTRPADRFESSNYYKNMQILLSQLSIEQQVADVERIRRILNVEKLNLIGHSFGGFIASLYAMEFPGQVNKLILISPANMLKMPQEGGRDLFSLIENNLEASELQEYREFMKDYFDYGKIFEKTESVLTAMNNKIGYYYMKALQNEGKIDTIPEVGEGYDNGWMTHAIYLSLGRKYDIREELKRISAPVLLIHGEKDMVMDESSMRTYSDYLKDPVTVTIPGAGHHSFDEQPEIFSEAVGQFLREE